MGVAGPNRRGGGGEAPRGSARQGAVGQTNGTGPRPRQSRLGAGNGRRPPITATVGKNGKLSFTIPSDYAAGRDVQQRIMADVERAGFHPDSAFAIRIALEEGLVNAIRHGNRLDASKKVHVEAIVSPARVEIEIEDEGPGFDRTGVPDPRSEENLYRPCGRGLLLIESYMTEAAWDRGGRRLRMAKENRPAELPR